MRTRMHEQSSRTGSNRVAAREGDVYVIKTAENWKHVHPRQDGEVSVQDLFDKQKAYLATDMTKTYELENRSAQPSYPHAQTISAFPRHHKVISRPHFRRTSSRLLPLLHRSNKPTNPSRVDLCAGHHREAQTARGNRRT